MFFQIFQEKGRHKTYPYILCAMVFALVMFLGSVADAQLADLDLLEDNDRSFGASVTAMPDPSTGAFAEARSAILLLPLNIKALHFEGGAGAYFTQSIVEGEVASALMWRLQGGPHWGKIGLQFYVEGLWKQGIDYAGFVRFGEFDLGRVILSGGLGTLVRADTQTDLAIGVERNAPGGGDVKVKGLILGSAEVDTELFECRFGCLGRCCRAVKANTQISLVNCKWHTRSAG